MALSLRGAGGVGGVAGSWAPGAGPRRARPAVLGEGSGIRAGLGPGVGRSSQNSCCLCTRLMVLPRQGENSARPAFCSCARKQPPTGVFSASSVLSTTFQCCQGAQAWAGPQESGKEADSGLPRLTCPYPRLLGVSRPALPTTMLSFQPTTDAPSPCPALKVWKVWEPTVRVSSSGGHKEGWGDEVRLCALPVAPPFPSLPGTH